MADNENLWMQGAPTNFVLSSCTTPCCVLTSWSWSCEFGCTEQPNLGGWGSFDDCKIDSQTNTLLNPNIGLIDPLDGSQTYGALSTGQAGQIPCGWECDDWNEMYPLDGNGNYSSPCIPCFNAGCGIGATAIEYDCVSICSASTSCYICDCLSLSNCMQVLDCPTFLPGSTSEHGPNQGSTANPLDLGVLTYATPGQCTSQCGCSGFDCVVYAPGPPYPPGHSHYEPSNPQKTAGYGCQSWTELQLASINLTWSNGATSAPYSTFQACCDANPDCCSVGCDHTYNGVTATWVDPSDPNVPCLYWPTNLTPLPKMFHPSSSYPLSPMADCLGDVMVLPSGLVVCDTFVECECACGTTKLTYINDTVFGLNGNSSVVIPLPATPLSNYPYSASTYMDFTDLANPAFTGLTLTHFGPWVYIPPPNNNTAPDPNFYDAGVTVSHDVVNTNFSTSCCYVCACIVGYGNPLGYGNLTCDNFQPGAGPEQGQANCWVNCNKQPSDSLQSMPCPICAVNPDDTWECTLNGCEDSICDYSPTGLGPSYTILDWQRDNNCYSADTCGGECRAACTCDTGTTMNVCVMLQEVQLGNLTTTYGPDVEIPTVYGYLSMNSCDFMANFPGIDCCDTVEKRVIRM